MSISLCISLLSGRNAHIEVETDLSLRELMLQARHLLNVKGGARLLSSLGALLQGKTVGEAGLASGDVLTLQVCYIRIAAASELVFAGIRGDGSVVTWGEGCPEKDDVPKPKHLRGVQQLAANSLAFAALLEDGSVMTWGKAEKGGDSRFVEHQLVDVQDIKATRYEEDVFTVEGAFAAILQDGSVVAWGAEDAGGDCSEVQAQLKEVKLLASTSGAFAAILHDGSVVTWGCDLKGGDCSDVQDQLHNVQQIQGSDRAFAAVRGNGSIVTWGDEDCGANFSCEAAYNVQQIASTSHAFAAVLQNGSVLTWGDPSCGGDSSSVQDRLQDVQLVVPSKSQGFTGLFDGQAAFAAILGNGSVVTWGSHDCGGDCSNVQDRLKHVEHIASTSGAFAALLRDGSVVAWGDLRYGGDCSTCQDQLCNVQEICGSKYSFSALRADGTVVAWGSRTCSYRQTLTADQLFD